MISRRDYRRFQQGSGVFNCRICNKRTRDTGENGDVLLCPDCFEESTLENDHNDCHTEQDPGQDCKFCQEEGWA